MLIDLPCEFSIYAETITQDSLMSAIAVIYTREGFVFVADGRRSDPDFPPESPQFMKSDECQKIFSILDKTRILAYTLTGLAGSDDGEFDVYREAQKQAERLSKRGFNNLADYAKEFCQHLKKAYNLAKRQGTDFPQTKKFPELNAWQISTLIIGGYFLGAPSWVYCRFFHHENKAASFRIDIAPTTPGNRMFAGSEVIRELTYPNDRNKSTDERLAQYIKPIGSGVSLHGAADAGRGYIDAHCDPLSRQLDEFCWSVGGKIHTASVTPNEGFRWIDPPKT